MFNSISEIIELSRENGYSFFNEDRQRQNKTQVHPNIYYGRYIITESINHNRKLFSVYRVLKDGACDIVQGEVYLSLKQAERYINMFLDYEEEPSTEELSYELR